jgi:hypothetical protein
VRARDVHAVDSISVRGRRQNKRRRRRGGGAAIFFLPVKKFFAEFLRIPLCAWERFYLFGRWSFSPGVTPAIIPLFLVRLARAARSFYPLTKELRLGLTLMHRLWRVNPLFLARQWPLGALFRLLEALTDRRKRRYRLLRSLHRLLGRLKRLLGRLKRLLGPLHRPFVPLYSLQCLKKPMQWA